MNILCLSTEEGRKNKKIDLVAVSIMAVIWISESFLSDYLWSTKKHPFVNLTWGHLTFTLFHAGLPLLWFFVIRKYPLSYLRLNKAKKRFWYFVAPLGMPLTFGFGIPTYILITKAFPSLAGRGMALIPPPLGYPLYIVLLVELTKYPLTSAIPHEIAYRGAVFQSINDLGRRWFLIAAIVSTGLYIAYHLPFDPSFSAVYFNAIIGLIAIFLLRKSDSLIPPMIFHVSINFFAVMSSWGYYTFR